MFIEMLVELGQLKLANQRLQKMKNIPEWKEDVRLLLSESLLGIYNSSHDQDTPDDKDASDGFTNHFTPMDSLYSYQELIQVHGDTCKLQLLLSAAYSALGKFSEAHSTLLQIRHLNSFDEPILKANLMVISAFILDSNQFKSSLK